MSIQVSARDSESNFSGVTGKSEVMQRPQAAVFARMPSGRDSPKTPALATLLIENASDSLLDPRSFFCPKAFPIKASDHSLGISSQLTSLKGTDHQSFRN
jgi:hypothetical protein